ncbi:MAG: hypothetical protein RL742_1493, partial [Bacteroidota bacterium]
YCFGGKLEGNSVARPVGHNLMQYAKISSIEMCVLEITNPAIYRRDHNAATFSGVSTPKSRVIKTFIVTQN